MNPLLKVVFALSLTVCSVSHAQSVSSDGGGTGPGNSKVAALEIKQIQIDSIKEASAVGIKNCGGSVGNFNDSQNCFAVLLKGFSGKDLLGNAVSGDMLVMGASQYGASDAANKITSSFHQMTVGDLQQQQTASQWISDASLTNVKVIPSAVALSSLTGVLPADGSQDRQVMLGGFIISAINHWRVDGGIASQRNSLTLGVE